jgi:hypothetical protein
MRVLSAIERSANRMIVVQIKGLNDLLAAGVSNAGLRLYHRDVLAALVTRLNQFGNTVGEGGEFAFVVLSQG